MQLQEVITRNPETIGPDDSIHDATLKMRDCRIGFLPVIDEGRVLGVLTDRDIVVRGIAEGCDPQETAVRNVMTENPIQVQATDSLERALETMAFNEISRVVVTDQGGQIVGVLTCGDAATACGGDDRAGKLTVAIHRRVQKREFGLSIRLLPFQSD